MGSQPLNLTEAAEALGLSISTTRRRILNGQLEAEKDGRRWVIYPAAIAAYRKRRQRGGSESYGSTQNTSEVQAVSEADARVLDRHGIRVNKCKDATSRDDKDV